MPSPHSETARLEAFSDGVIAIIITIMVLQFQMPASGTVQALIPLIPVFFSYLLSFFYIAIYWNNHHHLLHAAEGISGKVMWSNLHLLFWLSLIPFCTRWVGEHHLEAAPAALYGTVLLMAAIAYYILSLAIIKNEGTDSALAHAIGSDRKGKISIVLYILAIIFAFLNPWVTYGIFMLVALVWFIPDKRLAPFFDHEGE